MPRTRLPQNEGLPERWRITRNAYYYQVPPGLESLWDFKQTYRLGDTFEEALQEFQRRSLAPAARAQVAHLTQADIISAARPLVIEGVYFLIREGAVVYVGSSACVPDRLAGHISRGVIEFDSFHAIPAVGPDRTRLEQIYIALLVPQYNIRSVVLSC